MNLKLEKVYAVTFMMYTNLMKDTVSDWDGKYSSGLLSSNYLDLGKETFLLRESELDTYRKYGGGYRNLTLVGCIPVNTPAVLSSEGVKVDAEISLVDVNTLKDTTDKDVPDVMKRRFSDYTGSPPKDPDVTITSYNSTKGK